MSGMWFSDMILRRIPYFCVSDLGILVIEKEPIGYLRRGVLEVSHFPLHRLWFVEVGISSKRWCFGVIDSGPCFSIHLLSTLVSLILRMSRNGLRKESVGSSSAQGVPRLKT